MAMKIGKKLRETRDFTAVYAANDQMALGIIAAFEEVGLSVPGRRERCWC